MRLVLQIAGAVLLLQGLAPLLQRSAGQDPGESLFLANAVPQLQPWVGIALAVLGLACLTLARWRRVSAGARS